MSESENTAKEKRSEVSLEVVDLEKYSEGVRDGRLSVAKTYKIYIDGKFPRTESGRFYPVKDSRGGVIANVCLSSRKDLRNAVVAARRGLSDWSKRSAYNRGQILYRIAEMLEDRKEQFVSEIVSLGFKRKEAEEEVALSVDRLVYYAGWADKYQQVFSAVNPVNSSHFNFSVLEPVGVVGVIAPEDSPLLGLVSLVAPVITGGNTCVTLASGRLPLPAVTFSEVLHSSDVPPGVVNILTGTAKEILPPMAAHMDVNSIAYGNAVGEEIKELEEAASLSVKRTRVYKSVDWNSDDSQHPYLIVDFQETKTTWHPIGL